MDSLPPLDELLATAHVVSLPLTTQFRGITQREAVIFIGPEGATEFSPFTEYQDAEAATWLRAGIEFGWGELPQLFRDSIRVNATMPAVEVAQVETVLARYDGCRTVKVKVAEQGQSLDDDVARVAEVRRLMGPEGRVRLDANGGWNVDEAEHAIRTLSECDIEYVEQPCATVDELADVRKRVKYMGIPIAADESVRKASDPLEVATANAADLLIVKAQPLGGITRALDIVRVAGLPVTVSSALDTSVGLALGAHLAAAVPELPYDCGLGTASLLAADVTDKPLVARNGAIDVRRVDVSERMLRDYAAPPERDEWWRDRIRRCYALL
ncbi:o-succinylbenzoate synthase [Paramicrobacterium chengjingii]|uniref:o-succinylbenzoate synthase n=1 Tax=Paramicrobacterium chengjingii TaxID=2769067 RepID=A0ABX6YJ99_9MICO|nr:o-succinylbenzoate synthase [Microbacterium chengjingii]QPZ38826.1 o-succinylbenzoate synthase [Microbacterium chengjingii]